MHKSFLIVIIFEVRYVHNKKKKEEEVEKNLNIKKS
jgi:hypothetical protein